MGELSGIINIYKPAGMTSHDVVNRLRRLLDIKKIGHTGTLDPDAEGVLPMCVGRATKTADMLTASDKEYIAKVALGSATDTQDASGSVVAAVDMDGVRVTAEEIQKTAAEFEGASEQVPPMYSAVKIGGKKLYELARKGEVIERPPRKIYISKIEAFDFSPSPRNVRTFSLRVACSKGTYIRTLCNDIGEKLGCHAHMSGLVRAKSGRFDLNGSRTLDEVERMYAEGDLTFLTPVDKVFEEFAAITLPGRASALMCSGVRVRAPKDTAEGETYRVYSADGRFLSISKNEGGRLTILKLFYVSNT